MKKGGIQGDGNWFREEGLKGLKVKVPSGQEKTRGRERGVQSSGMCFALLLLDDGDDGYSMKKMVNQSFPHLLMMTKRIQMDFKAREVAVRPKKELPTLCLSRVGCHPILSRHLTE